MKKLTITRPDGKFVAAVNQEDTSLPSFVIDSTSNKLVAESLSRLIDNGIDCFIDGQHFEVHPTHTDCLDKIGWYLEKSFDYRCIVSSTEEKV